MHQAETELMLCLFFVLILQQFRITATGGGDFFVYEHVVSASKVISIPCAASKEVVESESPS